MEKPLLSPILTPRVPHDPVQPLLWIRTPPNNGDTVICLAAHCGHNASCVFAKRVCIHIANNWATLVDLLHHRVPPPNGSIFSNGCVGVACEAHTRLAKRGT